MTPRHTHEILRSLVDRLRCKPGWHFSFSNDEEGFRLRVYVPGFDSRSPEPHTPLPIMHYFPVPIATYNEKSWRRWVFECCRKIEDHELGEWFRVDDARPFSPLHGPGNDPYAIREVSTEEEARTDQQGKVHEP